MDELIPMLTHEDPVTRDFAFGLLSELGSGAEPAIPVLRESLKHEHYQVRHVAAATLRALNRTEREAIQMLIRDLQQTDLPIERRTEIEKEIEKEIVLLKAKKVLIQEEIDKLGEIITRLEGKNSRYAARVTTLKRDSAGHQARLDKIEDELELLRVQWCGEQSSQRRASAATHLGLYGQEAQDAVPVLVAALKFDASSVRSEVSKSLKKISPQVAEEMGVK